MVITRVILLSMILLTTLVPWGVSYAQSPCLYPENYLDEIYQDLTTRGQEIGEVDTSDPAALSLFYVETYQLRHRYENMTPDLPDCALRGHNYFTNILGNWEDILGLALATHANPAATEEYIAEIAVLNERIQFFTPLLLNLFFPPATPTPIVLPTEIPVLSTFYVATEGLSVRNGPGPVFDRIGVVTGGTPVDIVGLDTLENGDVWYHIKFESGLPDSDGTGWIFGALVTAERPAEYPEPLPTTMLSPDEIEESATATPTPEP